MRSSNQWLINLSKDESLWAKELDSVPSMIHFEYMQLKNLAEQGQVYGVLLQCKDTYETILRIPVIMALVVIDSDPKYKDGSEYNDIMKAFLESPMSMGNWNNLARVIIKNNKKLNLPENLIKILERTRKLYNTEITTKVSDVVAWRNDTIGHGALKFEDDANYQEEVKSLLNLLKEYFDGEGKLSIKGLYDSIYFQCGENRLVGDFYDKNAEHDLVLHIAGSAFKVSNYINDCDLQWYLFESFYCRKNIVKYSSYIDGKNNTVQNKYFSDLYEKHVLKGNKDVAVDRDCITMGDARCLEYLNMPPDYVKPEKLVELLQEQMDTLGKGVITLFMERGTGKSAFANQMSGLYHSKPLLKNTLSRCYHVSDTALLGINYFIDSIENCFRLQLNPDDYLLSSKDRIPKISMETDNPADDMAELLNFYHDKYGKDYAILVIDGIDEITEQSECILDFIPSKEQLDDGVFVVLTTRFSDEETVQGKSKKYIEKATQLADGQLEIRRHDEINTELLKRYIEKHENRYSLNNTMDKDALIKKSDYRILYLRAYLAIKDQVALDSTNETKFIESYMNYLLSFYGINQKQKLKEIAVSIALFPSISIIKFQEYLNCQEITYEFVGLFNDLLPLLTVVHLDGEDCYEFADASYADFVIEEYLDVVRDVVSFFNVTLSNYIVKFISYYREKSLTEINRKLKYEKCMFFLQGCLSLWNNSYSHKYLSDLFYESFNIVLLNKRIILEPFIRYGYGSFLHSENLNCIIEALYFGIQNISKACYKWTNSVIEQFGNPERRKPIAKLVETWEGPRKLPDEKFEIYCESELLFELAKVQKFNVLYDYILYHYNKIENIKKWFWVLGLGFGKHQVADHPYIIREGEYLDERKIQLINHLNEMKDFIYMDDFLEYKIECDSIPLDFIEIYLKYAVSNKIKEKLLNYQLKECLLHIKKGNGYDSPYTKSYNQYAEESFDLIVQQGYNNYVFDGDKEELSKIINKNYKIDKRKTRELAVKTLLNFEQSIVGDSEKIKIISEAYVYNPREAINVKHEKEEKLVDFCKAFCLRMEFEKNTGELEDFLSSFPFLEMGMETILAYAYGTGRKWHKELTKWIDYISKIQKTKKSFLNILLYKMMICSVDYMERNNDEQKFIDTLEKLVYTTDTYGFLLIHIFGRDTKGLDEFEDLSKMVYCSDNALYLFECLCKAVMLDKADKLLTIMEESIPIVDKALERSKSLEYAYRGKCEIQKYRFFALRRKMKRVRFFTIKKEMKLKLNNSFDKYIKEGVLFHKKRIASFIKNLSVNSDFEEFAYDIEMLLEFAYQTMQWRLGERYCRLLIRYLQSVANVDTVIKHSINKQIEVLEMCKVFMAFISGKNVVLGEVDWNNYNLTTSWGVGLYMAVESFYSKGSVTENDRIEYKKWVEIGLDDYYA